MLASEAFGNTGIIGVTLLQSSVAVRPIHEYVVGMEG